METTKKVERTFYVVENGEVISEVVAETVEIWTPDNRPDETVLAFVTDSQVVAYFRKWDSVQ